MSLDKRHNQEFGELALIEVSKELTTLPEYKNMVDHINSKLPDIKRDSQNFYKSASQFKGVTLDVTDLTLLGSIKHILAVLDQTRRALEEGHFEVKKKQILLNKKTEQYDLMEDGYDKDLLWVEILELNAQLNNSENFIKGAIRKMSFFATQYEALMEKLGKSELTEADYERNESRHHIMTALKQALNAARTRGGVIDEGNHIYLFEMGINGTVAQNEVLGYLQLEQQMIEQGEEPTFELTMKWLEACADKFANCAEDFAKSRGFVPLDHKSLLGEITNGS